MITITDVVFLIFIGIQLCSSSNLSIIMFLKIKCIYSIISFTTQNETIYIGACKGTIHEEHGNVD